MHSMLQKYLFSLEKILAMLIFMLDFFLSLLFLYMKFFMHHLNPSKDEGMRDLVLSGVVHFFRRPAKHHHDAAQKLTDGSRVNTRVG